MREIILLIILLILCVILGGYKYNKEFSFIKKTCKEYGIKCKVEVVDSKIKNAYVTQAFPNKVFITKALLDTLTPEETTSVLLHEVGHLVLKHTEPITDRKLSKEEFCNMRRAYETQADTFSVMVSKRKKMDSKLDSALIKIAPPDKYNTTVCTHPSAAIRVDYIRKIK